VKFQDKRVKETKRAFTFSHSNGVKLKKLQKTVRQVVSCPDVCTAFIMPFFIRLSVTVASAERSLSKLKFIIIIFAIQWLKNVLRDWLYTEQ